MAAVKRWVLAAMLALAGCHRGEHHGVVEVIREAEAPNQNGGLRLDHAADGLKTVPVEGIKTKLAFQVLERASQLEKSPCSRCHTQPLAALKTAGPEGKKAHWQIELQHAGESVMSCQTCHGDGAMDNLRTLNGVPVSFNASYQVCGQCHSKQLTDWVGGAHGKRVGGWAPPRVATSCAGCHNPHAPVLGHRRPADVPRPVYTREEKK